MKREQQLKVHYWNLEIFRFGETGEWRKIRLHVTALDGREYRRTMFPLAWNGSRLALNEDTRVLAARFPRVAEELLAWLEWAQMSRPLLEAGCL